MTPEQAREIVDRWNRTLAERAAQAKLTGLPREYAPRLFPSVFEAPDYWQAKRVLGEVSDADWAEINQLWEGKPK